MSDQGRFAKLKSYFSSIPGKIHGLLGNGLHVEIEETVTVSSLDGSKYILHKSEVTDQGRLKKLEHGVEVWSSPESPYGQVLIEQRKFEYDEVRHQSKQKISKNVKPERKSIQETPSVRTERQQDKRRLQNLHCSELM